MKLCPDCNEHKPDADFRILKNGATELFSTCAACRGVPVTRRAKPAQETRGGKRPGTGRPKQTTKPASEQRTPLHGFSLPESWQVFLREAHPGQGSRRIEKALRLAYGDEFDVWWKKNRERVETALKKKETE